MRLGRQNGPETLWNQVWCLNPNPTPELAFVNLAEGITVIDFEGQGIQAWLADLIEIPVAWV